MKFDSAKYETYFIKELCTIIKNKSLKYYSSLAPKSKTESEWSKFGQNLHHKLQNAVCQQAGQVCPREEHHLLFPGSIKINMLLISRGSNGVTGTVLVCGDPEQSTWVIINRKHTAEQTLCFLFFLRLGIQSIYSTQCVKDKLAGTWRKFGLWSLVHGNTFTLCSYWREVLKLKYFYALRVPRSNWPRE